MNPIQLQLELAEVNKILGALGALPYADVYLLIEKIQRQAASQLESAGSPATDAPAASPAQPGKNTSG